MKGLGRVVAAALFGLAAACSGGPTPPGPTPDAPTLTCPASTTVESPDNVPLAVSFTVPTAVGGQTPVNVTCTRTSGSNFPLGNTIVTCTATDGLQRQASCNFNVAVTPTPRIAKTKFLAFGDSITAGQCGPGLTYCTTYAERLRALLLQRYSRQSISVIESGLEGETASDDIPNEYGYGEDRLPGQLAAHQPEVLLLMEGTNDLYNMATQQGIDFAADALDGMVKDAKAAGATVVALATIPPMRYPNPGGAGGKALDLPGPLVPFLNERIRSIAVSNSAILVDVYAALNADLAANISSDNLHPSDQGLRVIAETFYTAIRQALDSTPTTSFELFKRHR